MQPALALEAEEVRLFLRQVATVKKLRKGDSGIASIYDRRWLPLPSVAERSRATETTGEGGMGMFRNEVA